MTAADEDAGTDDHVYLGKIGLDGGREFPLDDPDHDDFELEEPQRYKLGATWEAVSASRFSRQSKPGQVNDPAFMPIELEQVYAVYLRKQGDNSTENDDAYRLSDAKVVLYGPASPLKRTFTLRRRSEGPWLANENGHVVLLGGGWRRRSAYRRPLTSEPKPTVQRHCTWCRAGQVED